MDQKDLLKIDPNNLTYVRKGVLWFEKKPHYVIELVKEQNISYVLVYAVHPGTEKNPQKLAQVVVGNAERFSNKTRLGQIANKLFPAKVAKKWIPNDPIFVAPVIPNGTSTFTHKIESGFFEREADTYTVVGGEKKLVRGRNTGVFIGLSSIEWDPKISIPTESLLKALNSYKQSSFFDLEGNNSSANNPLATYYKESK